MERRWTIKGCDANWTMTISADPLAPEERCGSESEAPNFPADSFRALDLVFRDSVALYEYQRILAGD
jgi:hypothetical protein